MVIVAFLFPWLVFRNYKIFFIHEADIKNEFYILIATYLYNSTFTLLFVVYMLLTIMMWKILTTGQYTLLYKIVMHLQTQEAFKTEHNSQCYIIMYVILCNQFKQPFTCNNWTDYSLLDLHSITGIKILKWKKHIHTQEKTCHWMEYSN